ncbi:hypothetical protein GVN21_17795 [Caulobacter sp. SLTY]|uniref:hypothetical protein n=1 Tax=Caulobacter sp. SLTY TaxID=2683262 RepID=UPI0014127A23|nr:hypothetical protein [Caulobacter sp. SLTY]NBB17218.1 hypothetical protein [Caulobacter sp. SLTY]
MPESRPAVEPEALAYARGLLKPPVPRESLWPVIGAAAFWAVASLGLAFAMLVGPAPGAPEAKRAVIEQGR